MKGSIATIVIIIVCVIVVIGMVAYLYAGGTLPNNASSNNTAAQPVPTVPVKDFAPDLPANQKTTITIQTSDSSDIKYIVPKDQAATYIKNLPAGYKVVSESP